MCVYVLCNCPLLPPHTFSRPQNLPISSLVICATLHTLKRNGEVEAESEEGGVNRFSRYTEALPGPVVTVISDAHARWRLFPAFQMSTCAACVTHLCRLSVCDQDTVCVFFFLSPQHSHTHTHTLSHTLPLFQSAASTLPVRVRTHT